MLISKGADVKSMRRSHT